jgi:hypothetical protein
MSVIRSKSLDRETILKIYKSKGVIGVVNTYHNADVLIILDDFADEVDILIENEANTMLHELTDKIEKEL